MLALELEQQALRALELTEYQQRFHGQGLPLLIENPRRSVGVEAAQNVEAAPRTALP
jgi:hypothetical protein